MGTILYPVVRASIFIALLLLMGTQVATVLVRRTLEGTPDLAAPLQARLQRLLRPLIAGLLCLLVAKGALQLMSFVDPGEQITVALASAVLLSGTWGISWLVQLGAAIVLLSICGKRPRADGRLTAIIVLAQTGMGHAAGATWPKPLGQLVDAAHLVGAGLWLGTLGALAITALPLLHGEEQLPTLARVVRGFSTFARVGVSLVLASGVTAALMYAGPISTIAQSTWGKLLLVKVACMVGVVALGWYNWRIVTPALEGAHPACRQRLRRAVQLELALGLVMLTLTAFLVASALPGEGS